MSNHPGLLVRTLNGKEIEICDWDSNRDGSKFAIDGYYLDEECTPLTDAEIDQVNDEGLRDGWQ